MSPRILMLSLTVVLIGTPLTFLDAQDRRNDRGSNGNRNFDPTRWLERLDTNRNGNLDPQELSGRARDFLAGRLKEVGISLNRSVSIKKIASAMSKAREARNAGPPAVPGFGAEPEFTLVPGFEVEFGSALAAIGSLEDRYRESVLQRMQRTLDRYDRNKDGVLDRREIAEGRWRGDPSENDLNGDGLLTKAELAERYLARGKAEQAARERRQRADRERNQLFENPDQWRKRWETADRDERRRMSEVWRDRFRQADSDEDREKLRAAFGVGRPRSNEEEAAETPEAEVAAADSQTTEGTESGLDVADSPRYRTVYQHLSVDEKLAELGIEDEFIQSDTNGDGQLQMCEYESDWTQERLDEFRSIDANGDGVISPAEWLGD